MRYSISVNCDQDPCINSYADVKFSLLALALVSGQMVTVGNGIFDTWTAFSVNDIITGVAFQLIKIFRIDEPHSQTGK